MISFRNKSDVGASIAIIFAILVLALTLGAMFLPKPKARLTSSALREQSIKIKEDTKKNQEATKTATAEVAKWVWVGSAQQVAPDIFARVTALSQQHKLKLTAIRPQKTADASGLIQLPFQVSLSGHFPDVASMLHEMETPSEKLCVTLLQISAGEGNNDEVIATIGAIAFLQTGPAVSNASSGTGTTKTTPP